MTMQECYKAIGGNYEAVLGRLHSEALIQRFTLKFLEDQSYLQLKQALENKNYEDAFRSAHTLKGVCQKLSFDRLYEVRMMKTHTEPDLVAGSYQGYAGKNRFLQIEQWHKSDWLHTASSGQSARWHHEKRKMVYQRAYPDLMYSKCLNNCASHSRYFSNR